jgi:hypothetical protein
MQGSLWIGLGIVPDVVSALGVAVTASPPEFNPLLEQHRLTVISASQARDHLLLRADSSL